MNIATDNTEVIANMQKRIDELEQENETQRMQLAACSVISLSNTEDSLKEQSDILPEYKCATVNDVIEAVRREIDLRKLNEELMDFSKQANEQMEIMSDLLESWNVQSGDKETILVRKNARAILNRLPKQLKQELEWDKFNGITSQQSLANIKADAIEEFLESNIVNYWPIRYEDDIDDYANYLREQKK